MTSPDLNEVEKTLRGMAAEKAVKEADQYGWTEVRRGVYLDTAERMKGFGRDVSEAPYWMTTTDGSPPKPIQGAGDAQLRGMVDVDRDLTHAAHHINEMDRQASAGQESDLATPEQAMARRSRGRAM